VLGIAAAIIIGITATTSLKPGESTASNSGLPASCVKPAGGFLIIASELGYNDSVDHGVPQNAWPVISVHEGQNVTIVVCNADPTQPHGFQVDHYYDARTVAIGPGQALTVSFIAADDGTFRIYCNIACSVHWAMLSGELIVT